MESEDEWRKEEERWEKANGMKTGSLLLYSSNFTSTLFSTPSPPLKRDDPPLTAVWSWRPPPCSDLTGEVERRDGSC